MEQITIDLIPNGKMPMLHASQYDDGRQVRINLTENRQPYALDGTETLKFSLRKGDNCLVTMDIENTFATKKYIEFATTEQMTAFAGCANFGEIRIVKGDTDIGTLNFWLNVEQSPEEGGVRSDSEINNLARQVNELVDDEMGNYYDKTEADDKFATNTDLQTLSDDVNNALNTKADKTDTYTKTQVDNALNNKMNKANPSGTGSIAVGSNMLNIGSNSQTFGSNTKALGNNAFATGENTQASVANQFVFGKYNQYSFGNLVEIVGNGTSESNRSNARMLDWSGNETLAGDLTFNRNKSLTSEISRLDRRIDTKANASDVYTKSQTDNLLNDKANVSDVYTKQATDTLLNNKADVSDLPDMSQYYDKSEVDNALGTKADQSDFETLENNVSGLSDDVEALDQNKADKSDTYTKAQVNDIVYGILPDDTASGSVANFDTSLELPIKSLEVDVNAVQESGTPTPQSPKTITGVSSVSVTKCGSNLLDLSSIIDDDYYTLNANGSIKVLKTDNRSWGSVPVCGWLKKGTYTFVRSVAGGFCDIRSSIDNYATENLVTNTLTKSFTLSEDAYIKVKLGYGLASENYPFDSFYSINVGASLPFETYNGSTTLINLGGTYYGGYITQDKDGHRQFEVTHGIYVFDGTESFGALSSNNRVYTNILSDAYIPSVSTEKCVISTHYVGTSQNQAASGAVYKTTGNLALVFQDDVNGVDVATFKAFLANQYASNTPVTVVYKIATPYTIDLPDGEPIITLNGTNNIYADTGDSTAVFKCSVNDYVSAHSGGNLLGMGGVYLGGAKSGGGEEEPTEEEPKEVTKTLGDEPISKK